MQKSLPTSRTSHQPIQHSYRLQERLQQAVSRHCCFGTAKERELERRDLKTDPNLPAQDADTLMILFRLRYSSTSSQNVIQAKYFVGEFLRGPVGENEHDLLMAKHSVNTALFETLSDLGLGWSPSLLRTWHYDLNPPTNLDNG